VSPPLRRIRTLLVANRGEIAVRIILAARDLGMRTVAVYAEDDRDSAPVREADVAVALHGVTAAETYLDAGKLLDAALATGADAVHPGYGFLSESADFADAVVEAGLTWVGPRPAAIRTMGDKVAAKALATSVGVPTLPSAVLEGDDEAAWQAAATEVGFPLLVKAAAGGGGRGMRLVGGEVELADAVRSGRREAGAAFGDGTVFLERWLAAPRHVEIQVVGDQHGNVVHLGERECSVQRRHQKLVEEAPSVAVDADLRDQLGSAAVALARAISYDSVGTVEFLLDADERRFWFLEMNTRIQVEHRVTEEVTGADLLWWQLQCAEGHPLDWEQEDLDLDGHAVEVRLYAEDPALDWQPCTGTIHRFHDLDDDDNLVVDDAFTGGESGPAAVVSPHFDPLLAKVVARGHTRASAIGRLVRYLTEVELHGVTTNRDYLLAVLQHPDFLEGQTTTLFVADHPALLEAGPDVETVALHALAAALVRSRGDTVVERWPFAPASWRNVGEARARLELRHRDRPLSVAFRVGPGDPAPVEAEVDAIGVAGRVLELAARQVRLEVDGVARTYRVRPHEGVWYVNSALGQTDLVEVPPFPLSVAATAAGGTTAPVPGRVVSVEVRVGDTVEPGQTLVVLEAMKVEHRIVVATGGVVSDIMVAVGDTVDAHQVLVLLEGER
jgi:acetyl/propionyl-CoA carboxylase alpha subunit